MATRFYFLNSGSVFVPTTIRGTWTTTTGVDFVIPLITRKSGGSIGSFSVGEGVVLNPNSVLVARGVTERLAAQTVSGTMNVVIGVGTSDAATRYHWYIHAYVTQGDTNLVRGTLINNYAENNTNFWTTPLQGRGLQINVPITPLAIQIGDRIVLEVGYIARTILSRRQGVVATQPGPVASGVSFSFSTPPLVGSGLIVMMSGHKDGSGVVFASCTDNRGNTYQIGAPQRRISAHGEYGIIIYYCPRITATGSPFTITIGGSGTDNCFKGSAVEIAGLDGGSLQLINGGSNAPAGTSLNPTTGETEPLDPQTIVATILCTFLSQSSITVQARTPAWTQEHEELSSVWNVSNAGESNLRMATYMPGEGEECKWTLTTASHYVAGLVALRVIGAVVKDLPSGVGTIVIGTQLPEGVDAPDLTLGSAAVSTNAGHVDFSQNILLEQFNPTQLSHVVVQVAKVAPGTTSQLSQVITQVVSLVPPAQSRLSQVVTQAARLAPPAPSAISHVIVQVVPTPVGALPDLSGLYFLHPTKPAFHDSYYNATELKIPDPTIRTALLGE